MAKSGNNAATTSKILSNSLTNTRNRLTQLANGFNSVPLILFRTNDQIERDLITQVKSILENQKDKTGIDEKWITKNRKLLSKLRDYYGKYDIAGKELEAQFFTKRSESLQKILTEKFDENGDYKNLRNFDSKKDTLEKKESQDAVTSIELRVLEYIGVKTEDGKQVPDLISDLSKEGRIKFEKRVLEELKETLGYRSNPNILGAPERALKELINYLFPINLANNRTGDDLYNYAQNQLESLKNEDDRKELQKLIEKAREHNSITSELEKHISARQEFTDILEAGREGIQNAIDTCNQRANAAREAAKEMKSKYQETVENNTILKRKSPTEEVGQPVEDTTTTNPMQEETRAGVDSQEKKSMNDVIEPLFSEKDLDTMNAQSIKQIDTIFDKLQKKSIFKSMDSFTESKLAFKAAANYALAAGARILNALGHSLDGVKQGLGSIKNKTFKTGKSAKTIMTRALQNMSKTITPILINLGSKAYEATTEPYRLAHKGLAIASVSISKQGAIVSSAMKSSYDIISRSDENKTIRKYAKNGAIIGGITTGTVATVTVGASLGTSIVGGIIATAVAAGVGAGVGAAVGTGVKLYRDGAKIGKSVNEVAKEYDDRIARIKKADNIYAVSDILKEGQKATNTKEQQQAQITRSLFPPKSGGLFR